MPVFSCTWWLMREMESPSMKMSPKDGGYTAVSMLIDVVLPLPF